MDSIKEKTSELASAVLPNTGPEGPFSAAGPNDEKERNYAEQTRQDTQPEDETRTRDGMTDDSWKVKPGQKDGDRYVTTEINGAQPKIVN
jgi:hypothetical protein